MTIFFDLPLDIRQIIWRKNCFLSAQDSIKHIFRKSEHKHIYNSIRGIYSISIEFQLTYTKTMTIETIIYEDANDTLVVDIKDQNYIKVYLHPLNDEVQLYLSTKFNKRSFNYRKKTIDSPIINYYRNNEIYVCKYCSSISDRTYTIINR